jgi:hypothetical protein
MDGLDTYIDDYSKSEPIPPAMLAGLRQAQRILSWAEGKDEEKDEPGENIDATEAHGEPAASSEPAAVEAPAIEAAPAEPSTAVPPHRESIARGTE